jgi:multidrug resistance efflux pump
MRKDLVLGLADCTEFRQTLLARPPRIVHGTTLLLVVLLATALAWLAATEADLVVRATGLVRPRTSTQKVAPLVGGQVAEVHCYEGQQVRKGDLLIKLDTERLDNEIRRQERMIRAGEQELANLGRLREASARQFAAAREAAAARLEQVQEEVLRAKERQAAEIGCAKAELEAAEDEEKRLRQSGVGAARADLVKAMARTRELRAKLEKQQVTVEEGKVKIAQKDWAALEQDYQKNRAELQLKQDAKQSEVEVARLALVNLRKEREQAFLRAPMDGVVTLGDVKVGDLLKSGEPVVVIAEQRGFHCEVAVRSEDVALIREGMPARIKLDAYDYQKYGTVDGTVCFISPDSSGGEGSRTTTYLVKIALEGDEVGRGDFRGRVKLGMAGQAEIVTERESLLALLIKRIRQAISLG